MTPPEAKTLLNPKAFPHHRVWTEHYPGGQQDHEQEVPGMTLRDYFAAVALQGMLAHTTRYKPRQGYSANWHEAIAEEAHQLADAMLAARSKS